MDSPRTIAKEINIFLLDIARKNNLLLQYRIAKFNVFFSIILQSLQKTEILLNDSVLIFFVSNNSYFYILGFFVFDLQKDICSIYVLTDASFVFLLQKNYYIARDHISVSCFYFFRKILIPFTCLF